MSLRENPNFDGLLMSTRTSNVLANMGIRNLAELIMLTPKQLLQQDNFGRKSLYELQDALAARNLRLTEDDPSAIETEEGRKLFQAYQIAKLKWEIYRDKCRLRKMEKGQ